MTQTATPLCRRTQSPLGRRHQCKNSCQVLPVWFQKRLQRCLLPGCTTSLTVTFKLCRKRMIRLLHLKVPWNGFYLQTSFSDHQVNRTSDACLKAAEWETSHRKSLCWRSVDPTIIWRTTVYRNSPIKPFPNNHENHLIIWPFKLVMGEKLISQGFKTSKLLRCFPPAWSFLCVDY